MVFLGRLFGWLGYEASMNAYPRSNYRTKPFPQRGIMIILPAGETLDFPTRHSKNASTWRHHLYRPLAKVRARARRPPSTSKTDRHLHLKDRQTPLLARLPLPAPETPSAKKKEHTGGRERKQQHRQQKRQADIPTHTARRPRMARHGGLLICGLRAAPAYPAFFFSLAAATVPCLSQPLLTPTPAAKPGEGSSLFGGGPPAPGGMHIMY